MDVSETEYVRFIDIVSEFTLQITFKSIPLVKFCGTTEEYPKLSEKAIETLFLSQLRMRL